MTELGKYALPVLAAWGVTLLLLAGLVAQTLLAAGRARRALADAEQRSGARRG